jgi:hypothetical protein
MGEVAAQGTGVTVGASCTSTPSGADIEGDADDFASKQFVDPLSLLVDDQSRRRTLVFLVGVSATAEIAAKGGG